MLRDASSEMNVIVPHQPFTNPQMISETTLLGLSMKTNHLVDDARRFTEHLTLALHQDPIQRAIQQRTNISGG